MRRFLVLGLVALAAAIGLRSVCTPAPPPLDPESADRDRSAPAGGSATGDPGGTSAASSREPDLAPPAPGGEAAELPPCGDGPGFVDVAAERGLDYVNVSGRAEKPTILEANGAGVALLDLGGDGDLDAVFGQGVESLAALVEGPGADLEVFANDGSGRFERRPGPGLAGWWTGLAGGDVDGDGRSDLVAGGFGGLASLLQNEDGSLTPVADASLFDGAGDDLRLVPGEARAAGAPPQWATSLALFDADRDGQLDLFVGCYLDLDPVDPPLGTLGEGALALPCMWKGLDVYCGPRGMTPQKDRILRGRGDGTFEDRSATWIAGEEAGFTLAVATVDADGDGDTDLYVATDSSPNKLWINELDPATGEGGFVDYAPTAGVAVSPDGLAEAGMGVGVGDVDGDGRADLAVTNFSDEPTHLFFGADMGFRTRTFQLGLGRETRRLLSWSTHLCDFTGDGALELFTANGHVYPQADEPDTGTSYAQRDSLFRIASSGGSLRVEPIAPRCATSILALRRGTRGSAVGDVDGDGAPDLVIASIDGPAILGANRLDVSDDGRAHRLAIRLLGPSEPAEGAPRTPPDGLGARAIVIAPAGPGRAERPMIREVRTAEGYQSASSPWLEYGLGTAPRHGGIKILWPSGEVQNIPAGPAGRRLWIREGEGIFAEEEFRR